MEVVMYRRSWIVGAAAVLMAASLAGCSDQASTVAPPMDPATPRLIRELAAARGVVPLEKPAPVRSALVQLGQALAFDKILSGNRDVSCTSCHLPAFSTGDGRSLSIGAGGTGLGPARTHPDGTLIPRNAPAMFDLGSLRHMFWDGRVEVGDDGTFHTPAGAQLTPAMTRVFEFGALSAQPMFPVLARTEMRGQSGNELSTIPDDSADLIWAGLMKRLGAIPEYRSMFEAAYPGVKFDDMDFAYASNAIAGFIVDQMTFTNTPWDRFLAGDDDALSPQQLEGAEAFLVARCSTCHNGPTFSDDKFHDVAVVQLGPGEGNGASLDDDYGRMNVTGDPADKYRFRTTPLRNVELTAPYGHDGAYTTLRSFIEHYSESDKKLLDFDPKELDASLQTMLVTSNREDILANRDTLLTGVVLTPDVVDKLLSYMSALTDDAARDLSHVTPATVPSGLPVDRP
jgi:cytochrome c peroxidase